MIRLAINGFGRIGRATAKIALESPDFDLIAINDLTDAETLISLLRYDSIYGIYDKKIEIYDDSIKINDKKIYFYQQNEPKNLPWQALDVDVVIESTGVFLTTEKCQGHISAGAKKVVMSAPAKDDETPTYLIGVNQDQYHGEKIISNASCTTNCIAPIIKILNDKFGVRQSLMTTIHSYTADQNLVDGPHKDLRRARAAALNIVPTTTGAAKSVSKIIKNLDSKFDGLSIRVPTPIVSIADIVAVLERPTTIEEINEEFEKTSHGDLKNILAVTDQPVVSSDFIGNEMSAIIDLSLTNVVGGNLAKVVAWYDNEWGYSKRLVEIASLISHR